MPQRLLPAACLVCSVALGADSGSGDAADAWFEDDDTADVVQMSQGELVFLPEPPDTEILHSHNAITIDADSLDDGWVSIKQCYRGLDAVPAAEIVYHYRDMRALRVDSLSGIGQAVVQGQNVQLTDVRPAARLCIRAQARILYAVGDGALVLRNGPFHRNFLDGYFPLHVTLEVRFPADRLQFGGTSPQPQPGFEVQARHGAVHIDTWFAGSLRTEIRFTPSTASQGTQREKP